MSADAKALRVTVAYSPAARVVHEVEVQLPDGSTLAQALRMSGLLDRFVELAAPDAAFGIWGRPALASERLRDGDRVEAYRALRVDPKVARRARFVQQGARGAGLFARRRPGSKPGY